MPPPTPPGVPENVDPETLEPLAVVAGGGGSLVRLPLLVPALGAAELQMELKTPTPRM